METVNQLDEIAKTDDAISHASSVKNIKSLKDSKRAWVVCLASFLIQVWVVGILHAYGVFFVAFLEEFKCSKSSAAWIGSAAYGLAMAIAPVASMLINRFGYRVVAASGCVICSIALIVSSFAQVVEHLYGSFTFLFAFGCALAYTPCMTIASDYFEKYLTTATGIMTAGTATGTLVLSPMAQGLVTAYGWRWAFRVFAGTCAIGFFSALTFKPLHRHRTVVKRIKSSMARQEMHDLQLWKNKVFVIWIMAIFSVMFGYYIPYVHLMSYAQERGVSKQLASIVLCTLGASTAVGRILFGRILQKGYLDRLRMDQLSMVISGAGVMMLPLCKSFTSIMIYVIITGLVDGCYTVLLPTLTEAFTGEDKKVLAWGILNFFASITFTLGPPVAGWLYDATDSYDLAFHVAGIPIIIGAVLLFFIPWAQKTSHSVNVMKAAESSDEFELLDDEKSPLYGLSPLMSPRPLQEADSAALTLVTSPLTVHASGQAEHDVITIRSSAIGGMLNHRSRGSFLLVDLENRRVLAYSHQRDTDSSTPQHTDNAVSSMLVAKAIDVLKNDAGSIMSLQRVPTNVTTRSQRAERYQAATESSHVSNSNVRHQSPSQNMRSVDFCLPPNTRTTRSPHFLSQPVTGPLSPFSHTASTETDIQTTLRPRRQRITSQAHGSASHIENRRRGTTSAGHTLVHTQPTSPACQRAGIAVASNVSLANAELDSRRKETFQTSAAHRLDKDDVRITSHHVDSDKTMVGRPTDREQTSVFRDFSDTNVKQRKTADAEDGNIRADSPDADSDIASSEAENSEKQTARYKNKDKPSGRQKTTEKPPARSKTPDKPSGRQETPDKLFGRQETPDKLSGRQETPDKSVGRQETPEKSFGRQETPDKMSGRQVVEEKPSDGALDVVDERKRSDNADADSDRSSSGSDNSEKPAAAASRPKSRNKPSGRQKSTDKSSGRQKSTEKSSGRQKSTDRSSGRQKSTDKSSGRPESTEKSSGKQESSEKPSEQQKTTDRVSGGHESADKSNEHSGTERPCELPKSTDKPSGREESTEKPSGRQENSDKPSVRNEVAGRDKAQDSTNAQRENTDKKGIIPAGNTDKGGNRAAGRQHSSERMSLYRDHAGVSSAGYRVDSDMATFSRSPNQDSNSHRLIGILHTSSKPSGRYGSYSERLTGRRDSDGTYDRRGGAAGSDKRDSRHKTSDGFAKQRHGNLSSDDSDTDVSVSRIHSSRDNIRSSGKRKSGANRPSVVFKMSDVSLSDHGHRSSSSKRSPKSRRPNSKN